MRLLDSVTQYAVAFGSRFLVLGVLLGAVAACSGDQGPAAAASDGAPAMDTLSVTASDASAGQSGQETGSVSDDAAPSSGTDVGPGLDASATDATTQRRDAAPDAAGEASSRGAPGCADAGLAVCEDFESTAVGALPANWGARVEYEYGGKSMAVAADDAARGSHSLKIEGGLNGSQFLEYKGALGALATMHWGRIFFRVQVPAPWPASGVLHGDIVQHIGPHPGGGFNGVRWGIVENPQMKFQWIYNVQPSQGESEFADGTDYVYSWPGVWQCLEWHYDQPQQQGALWLDGTQVPIAVGQSHPPEIPVFTSLGVGWSNYQNAPGAGFVVWIDEVAFDTGRVGCAR